MTRLTVVTVLTVASCSSAHAGVTCWSGDCGNASINVNDITITGAGEFWFESVDGTTLGPIGEITVGDGVTGEVIIHIERSTGGAPDEGATTLDGINLTNNQGANLIVRSPNCGSKANWAS